MWNWKFDGAHTFALWDFQQCRSSSLYGRSIVVWKSKLDDISYFSENQLFVENQPLLNALSELDYRHLHNCMTLPDFVVDTSLQMQFPSVFDPASKYLSLIMPAYNEQDRIRSTLDETFRYRQLFGFLVALGNRWESLFEELFLNYRNCHYLSCNVLVWFLSWSLLTCFLCTSRMRFICC